MSIALTNISIGASTAGGASIVSPVSVPIPTGVAVFTFAYEFPLNGGIASNGTVTDSTGNTYTEISGGISDAAGARLQIFQALNVAAVPSGSIVYHTVNTGNGGALASFYVTGLAASSPLDSATLRLVTNGVTITVTSGVPTRAGELFICATGWNVAAATGNYTLDSGNGWAAPPVTTDEQTWTTSHVFGLAGATQINAGTGTKTSNPTFPGASPNLTAIILGLKAAVPPVYKPLRVYLRR